MRSLLILLTMAAMLGAKTGMAQHYKINVTVIGLHSDKGNLYLSLYNSAEGYPKKASVAFRLSFSSILNGRCTIVLDDIPKGEYAIACYLTTMRMVMGS